VVLKRWVNANLETLSILGGVLVWELAGRLFGFAWLPPFSTVVAKLVELVVTGEVLGHLVNSLMSLAIGVGLSLAVGLPVGALMGRFKRVDQALSVYVYAFFVAPAIVFAPIFFAIFGLARGTLVALIFMYTVFIIIINTKAAVQRVDRSLVEMARSYGGTEWDVFFRVVVPASLPLVFAGVQLGVGRGVKGMINGEMFIALVGLGALSQRFSGRFEAEGAFAVALVILAVALILNSVIRGIDGRVNRWTSLG
jgi:NitT/TauT family transport system permease protein